MKSYCKGFAVDRSLVSRAYETWLTKPSGKKNGWRVTVEYGSPDTLIDEICDELRERTLMFAPIRRYEYVERTNGKARVIGVESVKQQVCDYVAVIALEELLRAKVGFYQVAAVEGKGQRLCRSALRKWSHESRYHVKCDVRKCYPSIKADVVRRVLYRYVRSADVLYLCESLLSTYDGGLEIGSYFALQMAQLVLSFAYHHVEGLGKRRRGKWIPLVRHQIWHMDDFLLIGTSKSDLKRAARAIERYLRDEFGLRLKRWKVSKTSKREPLDLGGWVVRELGKMRTLPDGTTYVDEANPHTRVTLRDGIFLRGTRAFARFSKKPTAARARRCASYWGWFRNGDCYGAMGARNMRPCFARARRAVSRYDRLEEPYAKDAIGDAT